MTQVRSNFVVHAPVDAVFGFIAHPPNFSRLWPAMENVFDIRPSPVGGFDWRWRYRMLGFRIEGDTRVLRYEASRLIVQTSAGGGMVVDHSWAVEPVFGGTHLTLDMTFHLPAQWLSGLAAPVLRRENHQQAAIAMNNLKRILEPKDTRGLAT